MDSRIIDTGEYTSTIVAMETISSPLVSRGLRYEPLRDEDFNLLTDMAGNVLYEITATYTSILTNDSFITVKI